MKSITSSDNAVFKDLKLCLTTKGIKKQGKFILSGERLINEFLASPGRIHISAEIRTEAMSPVLNASTKAHTYILSAALFKELDEVGTHFNLLLLEIPEIAEHDPLEVVKGLEVVIPVGDPNNLGALIRSAVAFGADKIILTNEACHPFHTKAVKASAGAVLRAPIYYGKPLNDYDTENAFALEMKGAALSELPKQNLRLIVGEEGPGLHFKKAKSVSIKTVGVESLNATVAASIALYQFKK